MDIYLQDVLHQPEALVKAIEIYFSEGYIKKVKSIIKSFRISANSSLYFTGMGSSLHSAYGPVMFLNSNSVRAFCKSSSDFLYYGTDLVKEDDVVVIISQSGESIEVIKLVNELRKKKIKNILLVTNSVNCCVGKKIKKIVPMCLEPEDFVATRTYLSSVIINMIIAYLITGKSLVPLKDELDAVLITMSEYLKNYKKNSKMIEEFLGDVNHLEFLGRGPGYASALVSALCMKEYSKIPNEAMELGEFRHGPFEIVNKDFKAFVFAPKGITYDISIKAAQDLAGKGAKVVLVTNGDPDFINRNILTVCLKGGNEYLSQIRDFLPHQLLNQALADKLNVRKDGWIYGNKVTSEE